MKRADELRLRERFVLACENGKTIATLQGVDVESTDLEIGLQIATARAVAVPGVPGWKMQVFTLWVEPGKRFESYV